MRWTWLLLACIACDTDPGAPPEAPPIDGRARMSDGAVWVGGEALEATSLAWGDYDGDGDPDLAVGIGDRLMPHVGVQNRIYRNDGGALNLVWTAPHDEPTAAVAWGDHDGDGDLDLGVANAGSVANAPDRVYHNDGGTFVPAWQAWDPAVTLGDSTTTDLAWADADGDGLMDLALAQYSDLFWMVGSLGDLLVRKSTGATGFAGWTWLAPVQRSVEGVAWADVDLDGDPDLVDAVGDHANRLYRNDGGGVFTKIWDDGKWNDVSLDVAWGDFDGDGLPDLAVANDGVNRVYRNVGGTSLSLAWTSVESERSTAVAWGDWDADGDLDLAVANDGAPNRVYENVGGALTLAWSSLQSAATQDVAWADFDGDGDLDLAFANLGAPLRIHANSGLGVPLLLSPPSPPELGTTVTIKVSGAPPNAALTLVYGLSAGSTPAPGCPGLTSGLKRARIIGDSPLADADGRATFTVDVPASLAGKTIGLQAADLTGCAVGPVSWVTWPTWHRGSLAYATRTGITDGDQAGYAIASAGDQDGDGIPDLLIGAPNGSGLGRTNAGVAYLAPVTGPGTADLTMLPRLVGEAQYDEAGAAVDGGRDVTGDGIPDLLVGAPAQSAVWSEQGAAYLLHGPITWTTDLGTADLVLRGTAAAALAGDSVKLIGDATGDGLADLLVTAPWRGNYGGSVYVVSGATVGVLSANQAAVGELQGDSNEVLGSSIAAGDVDGDGLDDVLVGASSIDGATFDNGGAYLVLAPIVGVGKPKNNAAVEILGDEDSYYAGASVALGDLTGDGTLDLVLGDPMRSLHQGAVYMIDGLTAGTIYTDAADASVIDTTFDAGLGWELETADFDGDLIDDLVIAAPQEGGVATGEIEHGGVYLLMGPLAGTIDLDTALMHIVGDDGGLAGRGLGIGDDIDGNGAPDLLIGAPGADAGAAYVLTTPL